MIEYIRGCCLIRVGFLDFWIAGFFLSRVLTVNPAVDGTYLFVCLFVWRSSEKVGWSIPGLILASHNKHYNQD